MTGFGNPAGSGNADEESGPVFVREPPSKMDFSNSTGAEIPCQARGNPQPEIIWLRADGTAIGDVPGLRQVKIYFYLNNTHPYYVLRTYCHYLHLRLYTVPRIHSGVQQF